MTDWTNQSKNVVGSVKDQENPDTNQDSVESCGSIIYSGQSFTTGNGVTNLKEYKLYLKYNTGTAATIYCDIYAVAGDVPTGSSLGQASITALANANFEWKTFTFDPVITLSSNTKYVAAISSPSSSENNTYSVGVDTAENYTNGTAMFSADSGANYSTISEDAIFETLTDVPAFNNKTKNSTTFNNKTKN